MTIHCLVSLLPRRWAAAPALSLVLLWAGCSSGQGSSGADPTTTLPAEGGRPTGAAPPTTSAAYHSPQCQQVRAAVDRLDGERREASSAGRADPAFARQMQQLAVENPLCFEAIERVRIGVAYRESQAGTGGGGGQGGAGGSGQGGGGGGGRSTTTAAR